MPARKRVKCKFCGALLLGRLSQSHRAESRPYFARMRTEDIATVAARAYEVIEEERAMG